MQNSLTGMQVMQDQTIHLGLGNVNFIELITNNQMGVDMSDDASLDDKEVTELRLAKRKKILFKFRSQDVLHSAYMPHFRAQMNCVPGMVTQFAFTPKYTTEEMRQNQKSSQKLKGLMKSEEERRRRNDMNLITSCCVTRFVEHHITICK